MEVMHSVATKKHVVGVFLAIVWLVAFLILGGTIHEKELKKNQWETYSQKYVNLPTDGESK